MREAAHNDFFIQLPDVGTFRYGRRNIGDRLAIRRDYLRYTQEFGDEDADLSLYAALIATHDVLCVEAPDGWESIALLAAEKMDKAFELGALVKAMEDSFRKGVEKSGEGEGPGSGGVVGVPVQADLRAGADGSALPADDARGDAG